MFLGIKAVGTVSGNANSSLGLSSFVDKHLFEYAFFGLKGRGFVAIAKHILRPKRHNSGSPVQKFGLEDVRGGRKFSQNEYYIWKNVKGWLARACNPASRMEVNLKIEIKGYNLKNNTAGSWLNHKII